VHRFSAVLVTDFFDHFLCIIASAKPRALRNWQCEVPDASGSHASIFRPTMTRTILFLAIVSTIPLNRVLGDLERRSLDRLAGKALLQIPSVL